MEIEILSKNHIKISGTILTMEHYRLIKKEINNMISEIFGLSKDDNTIIVSIKDSISVPSSIIGYLLKLKLQDNINLKLKIYDEKLIKMLKELKLIELFNVEFVTD